MHHTQATSEAPSAISVQEQLSALLDGECSAQDLDQLSQAWAASEVCKQILHDYDLISSALRSYAPSAASALALTPPADFVQGVMQRTQQQALKASPIAPSVASSPLAQAPIWPAANDALFRWKVAASVATMAAVLSVAWQLGGVADPGSATLASAPAPQAAPVVVVASAPAPQWQQVQTQQGTMLRDAELELLMSAHRQYGGMTALQMPAGFLRTATFDPSVR